MDVYCQAVGFPGWGFEHSKQKRGQSVAQVGHARPIPEGCLDSLPVPYFGKLAVYSPAHAYRQR